MSLATRFARALVPAAVLVSPVAAHAGKSADLSLVKAHLQAADSMTADFVQTDSKRTLPVGHPPSWSGRQNSFSIRPRGQCAARRRWAQADLHRL